MKTFLVIYGIICIIAGLLMWYGIKHAVEVPQEIDIYDL